MQKTKQGKIFPDMFQCVFRPHATVSLDVGVRLIFISRFLLLC